MLLSLINKASTILDVFAGHGSQSSEEGYLPIKMDTNTKEYKIGTPILVSSIHMAAPRPKLEQTPRFHSLSAINALDEKGLCFSYCNF